MEMDPNPPSFNLKYDIGTVPNIGEGYAKGITAAGTSLAAATSGVMDVMNRNRNADDMLNALKQTNVLSPDQYNAIANKSLGAKEQMTGMYANQWILDQANQRAQSLQRGQGGVEVATQHAKMLDMLNMIKGGTPQAAGVNPKEMYWQPNQPQPQPNQQNPQAPAAPPPPPSQTQILAAQQQAGQFAGGPQVKGAPPVPVRPGQLPGTRYIQRTDPTTGKAQIGTLYPSGTFIAD